MADFMSSGELAKSAIASLGERLETMLEENLPALANELVEYGLNREDISTLSISPRTFPDGDGAQIEYSFCCLPDPYYDWDNNREIANRKVRISDEVLFYAKQASPSEARELIEAIRHECDLAESKLDAITPVSREQTG